MERIEVYKAYFFDDTTYYANALNKYEQGKKFTFNFSAGFFGVCWLLFRKMYIEGFIFWIVFILLGSLIDYLTTLLGINSNSVSNLLSQFIFLIISFVTLSFIGNYLYIRKSQRVVQAYLSKHNMEELDSTDLAKLGLKGGTSYFAAFIPVMILAAFVLFYLLSL